VRRLRNVKIVATLGPSSSDYNTIKELFEHGADVFRLNMSHGSYDEIKARHTIIRKIEKKYSRPIAILADLQGPKLRCGIFLYEAIASSVKRPTITSPYLLAVFNILI